MRLVALITIDVHNRDVIEDLVQKLAQSADDFTWQMRLRYYWESDLGAVGDCGAAGDCGTRLRPRIPRREFAAGDYRSDRPMLRHCRGARASAGWRAAEPGGDQENETTKDLAGAAGDSVWCSTVANLDAVFMSKFFKGLAQCGGWACFDEFNRINIEVLSVVAQQVISIQLGLRQHLSEVEFAGKMIRLQPHSESSSPWIQVRRPDRSARQPQGTLSARVNDGPGLRAGDEVMLFAEGFVEAKALSRKMVRLFKVSSGQLSQAKHYGFGMRAVKSVLSMAGARKRPKRKQSEAMVLVQAMCDSNVQSFRIRTSPYSANRRGLVPRPVLRV